MHEDRAEKDTKRARVLAAAVLLLLAAGLSGADASQPSLPDKWPACYFHLTSESLTPRLRQTYERRQIAAGVDSGKVARTELRWRDVNSPLLAALLPDTRWYLVDAWRDEIFGRPPCYAVAVRNDTSYLHWQLNHLLTAAGLLSDTLRRADAVRLAVCFGLLDEASYRLERRPTLPVTTLSDVISNNERRVTTATVRYALDALRDTLHQGSEPSYEETLRRLSDSTAIPALEFLRFEVEPGFLVSGDSGSARVICNVAERPRTFHLASRRGLLTGMHELNGPSIAYDTLPARPTQPPASNPDIER